MGGEAWAGGPKVTRVEYTDPYPLRDTTPPEIVCPSDIVVGNDPGQCSAVVNFPVPNATDNRPGVVVECDPAPGSVFQKGPTQVACTATDAAGNTASCSFNVVVKDREAPQTTCSADITLGCSVDLLVPASFSVTATDNCDATPTVVCVPPSSSGFAVGTTVVQCIAADADGNSSSCSFRVTRAPLAFTGFLPPIGGADSTGGSYDSPLKTFKFGSTVPVKFTAGCEGSPILTGTHRLQVVKYADETTAGEPIDATPQDAATEGNVFRLTDGQWHFNLDTKATGMSPGKWLIIALLSDGTQHSAWIQLK
jgi:hypothetical protein